MIENRECSAGICIDFGNGTKVQSTNIKYITCTFTCTSIRGFTRAFTLGLRESPCGTRCEYSCESSCEGFTRLLTLIQFSTPYYFVAEVAVTCIKSYVYDLVLNNLVVY